MINIRELEGVECMEDEDRETLINMMQKYPHLHELFAKGVDKELREIKNELLVMSENCDDKEKLQKIDEMRQRVSHMIRQRNLVKELKDGSFGDNNE